MLMSFKIEVLGSGHLKLNNEGPPIGALKLLKIGSVIFAPFSPLDVKAGHSCSGSLKFISLGQ